MHGEKDSILAIQEYTYIEMSILYLCRTCMNAVSWRCVCALSHCHSAKSSAKFRASEPSGYLLIPHSAKQRNHFLHKATGGINPLGDGGGGLPSTSLTAQVTNTTRRCGAVYTSRVCALDSHSVTKSPAHPVRRKGRRERMKWVYFGSVARSHASRCICSNMWRSCCCCNR